MSRSRFALLSPFVLAAFLFAALGACAKDDPVQAKQDGGASPVPTGSTTAMEDSGLPTPECTDFATEHEKLLNAPTESIAIKKKVSIPQ